MFYNLVCEAAEQHATNKTTPLCGSGQIGETVCREEEPMKDNKNDRRSERSRRLLGEALTSLLQERRYADLTVQDILDRAGIGRSTFYAHYWDKDDLLVSEIERVIGVLGRHMDGSEEHGVMGIPSRGLFAHIGEQDHLLQAFVRGPGPEQGLEFHIRTLRTRLVERVERHLRALPAGQRAVGSEQAIPLVAQAVVGTFLALLQWWLEAEKPLSPDQMDAYFRRLVLPGARSVLATEGASELARNVSH